MVCKVFGLTIKPSTNSTAAPVHFSHSMLSPLSVVEPVTASVAAVAVVAPPAVADSWQLLSTCTTVVGTCQTPDTGVQVVLPTTTACLLLVWVTKFNTP